MLAVHVTPRSSKNAIEGIRPDAAGNPEVVVKVSAPPEGGKANREVCRLVAKALGVPKSAVEVVRGDASRHKMLSVAGADLDEWIATLPSV